MNLPEDFEHETLKSNYIHRKIKLTECIRHPDFGPFITKTERGGWLINAGPLRTLEAMQMPEFETMEAAMLAYFDPENYLDIEYPEMKELMIRELNEHRDEFRAKCIAAILKENWGAGKQ